MARWTALLLALACLLMAGCASAKADEPRERVAFTDVREAAFTPPEQAEEPPEPDVPAWVAEGWYEVKPDEQGENAFCGPSEPFWDVVCIEHEYEPENEQMFVPAASEGLTREGGVNYHDGRRETWYSSNVLYHKDTADWEVDDEGFYRTEEGYYVVAASDMEQGTVLETSKGEAMVLDSGCAAGTTDFYTKF